MCKQFQKRKHNRNMAKILRNLQRTIRSGSLLRRCTGSAISFSIVTSFQESNLEKPNYSLNLDNMKENWSHKFLLQQSRLLLMIYLRSQNISNLNCSAMSMESCSVTLTQTVVALQSVANSYCDNLTELGTLLRLVLV